jgi:hypothetical protein
MTEHQLPQLRLECLRLAAQLLDEARLPAASTTAVDQGRDGHPRPSAPLMALARELYGHVMDGDWDSSHEGL